MDQDQGKKYVGNLLLIFKCKQTLLPLSETTEEEISICKYSHLRGCNPSFLKQLTNILHARVGSFLGDLVD